MVVVWISKGAKTHTHDYPCTIDECLRQDFLPADGDGCAAALSVTPAVAEPAEPPQLRQDSLLAGTVLDANGLPLIGAFIAVALPGSERPAALTASDQKGQFSMNLVPGTYTLMASSFGHVSAVMGQLQVPRAEPVRLQLRSERQVLSLLSDNAPLDISYAFRPGKRDILRAKDSTLDAGGVVDTNAAWINNVAEGSVWDNVGGELSMRTVASPTGSAYEDSRSATEFSMGSIGAGQQDWVFRGQVAGMGVMRARSDISRVVSDTHAMRLGVGFAGRETAVPGDDFAATDTWVGSLSADDFWRLGESLQFGYGVSFEHYNYLDDSGVTSPRIQVAYVPFESVTLMTGISYDAEAPGLAELRFQVDPLAVRHMDIVDVDGFEAERTLRFELGMSTRTENTEWTARAFHDGISQEIVGLWMANDAGSIDYLVTNLGDAVVQGVQLDVRRSFMGSVAGRVSYSYARREGSAMPAGMASEHGILDSGFDMDAASVDEVHELAAGVETVVGGYDTRLNATFYWQSGVPVIRAGGIESIYERLDVNVRQPLPFRALSSDWSALLEVQNVLGTSYEGVFDFGMGDAPVLARLFSGGLAVRF